jgi:integrase/recombinase XerD
MAVPTSWTLDALVDAFETYQRRTRGLRDVTLRGYVRFVRLLIREALGDDPIDVGRLDAAAVIRFFRATAARLCPHSMKVVGSGLRSFFRFLRMQGACDARLEAAIPRVSHRRLSTLPRCLSDAQFDRLLVSMDVATPCGYRDRAIVFSLATLGLRPGEVAELRLDDIDWRAGTVHLRRRKTGRGAVLPLPRRAGRAIADYLRHERPQTGERFLFAQHLGRRRGARVSSDVVSAAVRRALRRAGIDSPLEGAYVFRHTVASRMVRRGTSLKEIADLLGHRSLDTTTTYAKLDLPALYDVALPWPDVTP